MNVARVELIHQLIDRAVAEGLSNQEIRNLIGAFARASDERDEGLDYLAMLRTRRGEDLNVFSGESNLTEFFRSPRYAPNDLETQPSVHASSAPKLTARGYTVREINEAASAVRTETRRRPTRTAVAGRLGTSESTLRRAMNELGMGAWPPPRVHD